MIPKHQAPGLTREQRRHPERMYRAAMRMPKAMPWLLYGLLRRGGYLLGEQIEAVEGKPKLIPPPKAPTQGIVAKARGFLRRIMGR